MLNAGVSCSCGSIASGFLVANGTKVRRLNFIFGMLLFTASNFVFLPNQTKLWIYLGLFIFGFCASIARTSGFSELVYLASTDNSEQTTNFAFHSALSGAWAFAGALSSFILPLIESSLLTVIPYYLSLIAALITGLMIAILVAISSSFCSST